MPPTAAIKGRIAWRTDDSSPTRSSRFTARPTTKKKMANGGANALAQAAAVAMAAAANGENTNNLKRKDAASKDDHGGRSVKRGRGIDLDLEKVRELHQMFLSFFFFFFLVWGEG